MHMIVYMSEYTGTEETLLNDLPAITAVAKLENAKSEITGVLFYLEGKFLQIIEGEEKLIRQLMTNIEKDSRHTNLEVLIDTAIESRGFYSWNMDTFNLKSPEKFNQAEMRILTENFAKNLLPRSDTLVYFYKSLLEAS